MKYYNKLHGIGPQAASKYSEENWNPRRVNYAKAESNNNKNMTNA
jgi:hypothetical protein